MSVAGSGETAARQSGDCGSVGVFPATELRCEFPALQRAGDFVFFDNAAGAQIPRRVLDAVNHHLLDCNVQRGGRYARSAAVDASIQHARAAVAAFLNARRPEEIAFGMNATSFIRLVSLAIGQRLTSRHEIVVTDLDHEANIATWLALERAGATFRWWHVRDDGRLHLADLEPLLGPRTRLLACALASNALGSLVDVRGAAERVHAAGGEIFLDAVHYAPHGPIDVQAFGCDYLVCSGYKIFAPHMGFLWGRYEALAQLPTFREDFIPDEPPGKIEAGTFIYENVAGMAAAVEYLAALGRRLAGNDGASAPRTLREDCQTAMCGVRAYEQALSRELLRVLRAARATIHGPDEEQPLAQRVPTVLFNLPGSTPAAVTQAAADAGIGIRDGHMYAPRLMRRLGLSVESGAVRASLVHYNTLAEVERFGEMLRQLRP
jgi:cysteine desulfurase family protein (TIGR01976 family)